MSFAPTHLLVPVALDPEEDFNLAKKAVYAACDLAEKFASKITILHLSPVIMPQEGASLDVTGEIYHSYNLILQTKLQHGRLKMEELEKEVQKRGIKVKAAIVDSIDSVHEVICESAKEINADLIVMSTHGRKGLSKVFLGSVSQKVFQKSSIDVLLLTP